MTCVKQFQRVEFVGRVRIVATSMYDTACSISPATEGRSVQAASLAVGLWLPIEVAHII